MHKLDALFKPKSIAIVGISENPNKLGTVVFNNLVSAGYTKPIFLINPKYTELFGHKVFKSVAEIKEEIDLLVIAIPSEYVVEVVEEAAQRGTKAAIIISAGFKDQGEKGAQKEAELKALTQKYGIRILGPNCLGSISTDSNVNASFAALTPSKGSIAFFSQSGAVNTALLDISASKNLGFKHFVSVGNKNDINENGLLKEWLEDDEVKVIGGYLEDFFDGAEFVKLARKSKKPIVVLHAGQSLAAQKAIESHTGSLASSHVVVKTALKQSGVILVESLEEMFSTLLLASRTKDILGKNIAIITNAGGPAILTSDILDKYGLNVTAFHKDTIDSLHKVLPTNAATHNPVDLIGDAQANRYKDSIEIVERDERVDALFVIMSPQQVTQIEETVKIITNACKTTQKPIIAILLGEKYINSGVERLNDAQVAVFNYIEEAVRAYKNLSDFFEYKSHAYSLPLMHAHLPKYKKEVSSLSGFEVKALPEVLAKELVYEAGITLPKEFVVHTIHEAKRKAELISYPVVLKVTTETLSHKTEEEAVILNIQNEQALEIAFRKLMRLSVKLNGAEELLLQQYLYSDVELIIGATRDGDSKVYEEEGRGFGHLILFGHGGIYTEIYKDIATTLVPAKKELLIRNLKSTDVYRILNGYRSDSKYNVDSVVDTLMRIQKLVLAYPEIKSIDINPAFPTKDACVCVDVKIFVQR